MPPRRRLTTEPAAIRPDLVRELLHAVQGEVGRVVVGQDAAVELLLGALLVGGHVLLEGVPGVAKTLLGQAFSRTLALDFGRVQFTPDMLPSDLTGTVVLRQGELSFSPGPVFTQVLLGDEVNRTPPKTQSALLEAMQEAQVTVDGTTHLLPAPFLVLATQNPLEFEGTYPLPEAQLDRFHIRAVIGYPSFADEFALLSLQHRGVRPSSLRAINAVADADTVADAALLVDSTRVDAAVLGYVLGVIRATREVPGVQVGASPRAGVHLLAAAKAAARMVGRDFVTPDDVAGRVPATLGHRVVLSPEAELERLSPASVLAQALSRVPVPDDFGGSGTSGVRGRSGPVPTPLAAGLTGVIALVALEVPGALVAILLLALAAGMTVDFLRVRRPPTVLRTLPALLSRGVPAPIGITVSDPSALLAQPTPAGLDCTPVRGGVGSLTALRRGRHVLPPVVLRRTGPLRLGAWTHRVGGEAVLRVYPDLPAAQRLSRAARVTAISVAGQSLRGPLGLGTDFEALRDYRPDDDVRQVNWRATARMQRPMSNTYRVEQSRRVLIALDCGRVVAAPLAGRLSRLDIAVDAAAAVAMSADRVGDRVGLIAYDDGLRALVRPSTSGGRDVLRALADLEPRLVDSDPDLLAAGLPRGQRTTVLIFTDLLDVTAVRSLVAALPGIASRHTVSVLSVTDQDLEAVLRMPVRTMTRATLVAAAADLVEARLQAAALLRRAGARVIEVRADQLPAAAVRALTAGPLVAAG